MPNKIVKKESPRENLNNIICGLNLLGREGTSILDRIDSKIFWRCADVRILQDVSFL